MSRSKKAIQLTVDQALADRIRSWAATMGFMPGMEREATRQLIEMSLASTPEDGLMHATRSAAAREVKVWVIGRTINAMNEIGKQLESVLRDIEGAGPNVGQR